MKDLSAVGNAATAPKKETGLGSDDVMSGEFRGSIADNGGVVVNVCMTAKRKGGKNEPYSGYCPDKVFVFSSMGDAANFITGIKKGDPAPDGGTDHMPQQAQAPSSGGYPAPAPIPSDSDSDGY